MSPRLVVPGLVAGILLLVGAAVASGAVGVASPTPLPATAVIVAAATPTVDTAGYALTQQNEVELCQCGK